ncbi:OmpA family protein [Flavobacteriaceae bacterium Ap0902]|nr:OmpA family protein [Flavobacteriaceae bacterium Ap0902]
MRKQLILASLASVTLTSCVSKKKYVEMETKYTETLAQKENCESRMLAVQQRVDDYYAKINSLQDENSRKLEWVEGVTALSNDSKNAMRETLRNVDPAKLAQARTLEDSLNLAVSYNLNKNLSNLEDSDDLDITIDKTVVMINISDKLLFQSGSASVNIEAYPLLERLAKVINSEPAMEVMVEGHTDDTKIKKSSFKDNWELSVERSTAIVRLLQDKYNVDGKKLIASGRSSFNPLVANDSYENRAKNRRTRIVILPNLDKFLAMLQE